MLKRGTCGFISILTISLLAAFNPLMSSAQTDTVAADSTATHLKKKDLAGHQLCIGTDIFRPIVSQYLTDRHGYEIAADYYLHNEYYLAAEGGWGDSKVNYPDLVYSTTNNYLRLGFNKSILTRDRSKDWDMMFFGLRLGYADVSKSRANYTVVDSLWGNVPGYDSVKRNFSAFWVEVTGGVRVELVKGICIGWNIRGKFLMNGKSFKNYAPLYIAGFGRGDKNAIFDFDMYVSYAIRWKRKSVIQPLPAPTQK